MFAIQNPTNNLEFSDIEVETIATKFKSNYILKHDKATLTAFQQQSNSDNFKNAHWLHFSSHGYFDLDNPYKSAKDLSKESLKYTRLLRNLKDYQNTIDINKNNYDEKLRQISAVTQEDNLSILEIFYKQDSERFYKQINADIGYFEQGLTLLEQAIASIRGIVEIEQTKRDRSLERTVQILGIGLGGGAIVSGVVTQHIDKPFAPINFKYPVHPLVSSLCWSIAATFLFIGVGWLIAKSKNVSSQ